MNTFPPPSFEWRRLACTTATLRREARERGQCEAAQLLSQCGEVHATRLAGDWKRLLKSFGEFGPVACLTSNQAAVQEQWGPFEQLEFYGDIGVAIGERIDLRLFMEEWAYGYALREGKGNDRHQSLCFFDLYGRLLHRISLLGEDDLPRFDALCAAFPSPTQDLPDFLPLPGAMERPDELVDVKGFRAAWLAMEDTAAFADFLRAFGLRREQALRLAPPGHAWRVDGSAALLQLLRVVVAHRLRLMTFLRSPGCLQIRTGTLCDLSLDEGGERLTLEEPDFSLLFDLPIIATAWVVRKPTLDGIITSLELFDAQGDNLALFFGKRGYSQPEDRNWRNLLHELPRI